MDTLYCVQMTDMDLAHRRLWNQHIAQRTFKKPDAVVSWLGAVQAQDFLGALWAVGLRMRQATESDVEQALADRTIVRTWPMRGTLHFVAAEDVRWMLKLLTPRIIARSARRFRELELEEAVFARSRELFIRVLRGGKQLSREAMYQVLEAGHISTAGQRGIYILGRLAQEGLICFGARQGKQQTFTLLDEWVPHSKSLERDEALAELARRYFTSHGPATLQDFVWWSGLAAADARAALEMVKPQLAQEVIHGKTYWFAPNTPAFKDEPATASLLPAFDEYIVGYRDRSAVLESQAAKPRNPGGMLSPVIILDGRVVATWKRTFKKDVVTIVAAPLTPIPKSQTRALAAAADRYGAFIGYAAVLEGI